MPATSPAFMLKLNHTLGIQCDMWRQADSLPDDTERMSELLGTVHGRASASNRNLIGGRFDLGATLLFSKFYQSDGVGSIGHLTISSVW